MNYNTGILKFSGSFVQLSCSTELMFAIAAVLNPKENRHKQLIGEMKSAEEQAIQINVIVLFEVLEAFSQKPAEYHSFLNQFTDVIGEAADLEQDLALKACLQDLLLSHSEVIEARRQRVLTIGNTRLQ